MKTYVATKNTGKLHELNAIFAGSALDLAPYAAYLDPSEGELSYADNAWLKARTLWEQLRDAGVRAAALGDDSGIEVAALDGRPGVLSARYGGEITWQERRAILLRELNGVSPAGRTAKFCCAMALVWDDGTEYDGYGEAHGHVALAERGQSGFGYDPLFIDAERGVTFAQLRDEEKNAISHRRRAADALLRALRA